MLLKEFDIDGYIVTLTKIPVLDAINNQSNFFGQKMHHPFTTGKFTKEHNGRSYQKYVYLNTFINEQVEQDIKNAIRFEIKHDGSCGLIKDNIPFARYDVTRNKTGDFIPTPSTMELIPCEPKPTSPDATHWPHFRDCRDEMTKNGYKWHISAFNKFIQENPQVANVGKSFTCEFMGKPFNHKISDPMPCEKIVVHGSICIDIPIPLRTFDGLTKIIKNMPYSEGIIVHTSNNIYKIRRDLIFDSDINDVLKWPTQSISDLAKNENFTFLAELGGFSSIC